MLTWLILLVAIITLSTLNLVFNTTPLTWWQLEGVIWGEILIAVVINALAAIFFSKCLKKERFNGRSFLYHTSRGECRFLEKMGVKRWKDHVLELGKLNGFRKDRLPDQLTPDQVQRFIIENRIGLKIHFWSMVLSLLLPLPCLWLPVLVWRVGLPVMLISIFINSMSFAILRYNNPRLDTLLRFALRKAQTMVS